MVRSATKAILGAVLILATAGAREARADAPPQAAPQAATAASSTAAAPAAAAEAPKPRWTEALTLNAFVEAGYLFNFNNPDSKKNGLRYFDAEHNTFSVSTVEVVLQKSVSAPGDVGFRADFDMGGLIAARAASAGEIPGSFGLRQGYASWIAPVGSGLRLDVGKFITMAGFEYIEAFDTPNDNVSRSLLFNYAIPFTHTGVQATYVFSPVVKGVLHLVNGWDNALSLTKGKTVCGQLNLTPNDATSLYLNYCGGSELVGASATSAGSVEARHLVDFNGTVKVTPAVTLGLNGDFGLQTMSGGDAAKWYGVAAYVKAESEKGYGLALRGEWFKDDGGTRMGAKGSAIEVTVTPFYKVNANFTVRAEARLDVSSDFKFDKGDKLADADVQPTLALNTLFTF